MAKAFDLVVKVGSYMKDGNEKARYKNIGVVNTTQDGKMYALIDRTFNPAGVPNPDNKDMVMVSMFEPKDDNQKAKIDPQSPNFGADLEEQYPF